MDLIPRRLPPSNLGAALIGQEEEDLLLEVIRRKEPFRFYGWDPKNPPPVAARFEQEFTALMGVRHGLAVTSGTAALEIALTALGIGPGDEVIIPVWSWDSCFTAVVRCGALPVLAEIDDTFCLSPTEIVRLSTPRTKAVLVVHYQGVAADMDAILELARKTGIKVIEDCAESPGVTYRGKRVGSLGDIGTFSFQFAKSMTSGEGGAVVTNDPLLFERAVRMHDLGKLRPFFEKQIPATVPALCGGQYRITELQAAVALAQLRKLDGLRARCRLSQEIVMKHIGRLPGLRFRRIPDPTGDSGFEIYFCVETPELAHQFVQELKRWNIGAAKGSGTRCHYELPYCQFDPSHAPAASPFARLKDWPGPGYRKEDFPKTEALIRSYIAVPIGVLYTNEDADYIGRAIAKVHRCLSLA